MGIPFECSPQVDCPGSDSPILNLSSEGPDSQVFIGTNWGPPFTPPPGNRWTDQGCLTTCDSTISQADADQCAARQELLCVTGHPNNPDTPPTIICNTPQTAVVNCPDGSPFAFTVAGGLFCGRSQTLVNEQALAFATQSAQVNKICMGNLKRCTCINQPYSGKVTLTGIGAATAVWSLFGGSFPPGITMDTSGLISGVPIINGTYSFTLQATTFTGSYMRKTFSIVVLEIVSVILPPFSVGVPYSYQLQAAGGSGNYNWKISSGTLPPGLTMSITGLISGTPT